MRNRKARTVAWAGMLFALAIALSFMESLISPFFGLMPAMKLGLSNIVVMFALLYLGKRQALALVVLKAGFALLTRGATAGFLSFCGGITAFLALCLLLHFPLPATGYIFSAVGALAHNFGQL
ncbi:MAG: Gx transporter family protein, partial [Gemmiger sp.]|nr:Gx transporter family protein [Gemmiger sp.]